MSLQEREKCLLSICFALFLANNAYKSFRRAKKCGLFSSVFKKIIPNNTISTFQEVGGVCKSFTEIKDHAKNFPNAPRIQTTLFCATK